jgi:hypothetical protein
MSRVSRLASGKGKLAFGKPKLAFAKPKLAFGIRTVAFWDATISILLKFLSWRKRKCNKQTERYKMAKLIQAYATYGPRIDLLKAADPEEFMESITQRTTLSEGVVKNVQSSEVETLVAMLKRGQPVHTGVAIFTPTVDAQGNLNVNVRVDKRIISGLNVPGAFKGDFKNGENIGKTTDEIVHMWNQAHPEDMIIFAAEPEPQPF